MNKNELISLKDSVKTEITTSNYNIEVNLKIRPVRAVRKTVYGQGTLTDEQWIEFQEILQEVVDELSKKRNGMNNISLKI